MWCTSDRRSYRARAASGPGDQSRHDVAFRAERPALATELLKRIGQGHKGLKLLERAHQRRAMRPGTRDGAVEMISAGLGGKFGIGLRADAMAKDELALGIEPVLSCWTRTFLLLHVPSTSWPIHPLPEYRLLRAPCAKQVLARRGPSRAETWPEGREDAVLGGVLRSSRPSRSRGPMRRSGSSGFWSTSPRSLPTWRL